MSSNNKIKLTAPSHVYTKRRAELSGKLIRPIVIFAGRAPARNYSANSYQFRAGSTYLYFGGPAIEGAAWIIEPNSDGNTGCHLIRKPSTTDDALWVGETITDNAISSATGIDISNLAKPQKLKTIIAGRDASYIAPPCLTTHKWIADLSLKQASNEELLPIVNMRLIKDEHELVAMRKSRRCNGKKCIKPQYKRQNQENGKLI